jgi:hypothetical protein
MINGNIKGLRIFTLDPTTIRGDDDGAKSIGFKEICDCPPGTCANDNDQPTPVDIDPEFAQGMEAFLRSMMGGEPLDLATDLQTDEDEIFEGEEIPVMSAHDKVEAVAQLGRTIESVARSLEAHTALVTALVTDEV